MNFFARKQELLERAKRVEEEASRVRNAQAQDLMHALATLYREMAEELEDSGLFERRLFPFDFVDLAGARTLLRYVYAVNQGNLKLGYCCGDRDAASLPS